MFTRKTELAAPANQPMDTPAIVSKPPNGAMTPARPGGLLSRGVSIKGSVKFLNELVVDGEVEGTIIWPPRGASGFGYDPIFQPEGYTTSFGEMTSEEKHGWRQGDATALSHRARAFKTFVETCLEA